MDPDIVSVIKEAVSTRLRDETIERAVGRTVRRRGLDFSRYIQVMSALREVAVERKITPEEAAEALCEGEGEDQ